MSETTYRTGEGQLLTSGEIAKACGVTVRTVQYYDERGLLSPTERSDGGRRLYDEAALRRLETICLLKSLGLPLKAIRGVLASDSSPEVLRCLLLEQEKVLDRQIADDQATMAALHAELARLDGDAPRDPSAPMRSKETKVEAKDETKEEAKEEFKADMEHSMSRIFADKDTRLYRTQRKLILEAIVMGIVQWACIIGGFITGNWWPLAAAVPLMVVITAECVFMYHRDARYVCPHCGEAFQPGMREFFFAAHTPKTRKLTCPQCGKKEWCAEVAAPPVAQ